MIPRPALLSAALLALLLSTEVFAAPQPRGVARLAQLDLGQRTELSVKTPEGIHRLELTRIASATPQYYLNGASATATAPSSIKLFRGRMIRTRISPGNVRVAASLVDGELTVTFFGRRRSRLFRLHAAIDSDVSRLSLVASRFSVNCALAGAASIAAVESDPATIQSIPFAPIRYIELATDADYELFASRRKRVAATNAYIEALINDVNALYLDQLGLRIQLVAQNVFTERESQPYRSSDPQELLFEFRDFVRRFGHLGSADAYHLFTGKNIDDNVVGLAFIFAMCDPADVAFGLTQRLSSSIQPLITAHELGHNMGAEHASGPPSLMSAVLQTGANQFSAGSRAEIADFLGDAPACLAETASPRSRLTASVREGRNVRFRAVVNVDNIDPALCTIDLFAAVRRGKLAADRIEDARLLASQAADGARTLITARTRSGNASSSRRNLFVRARVRCGSEIYDSPMAIVPVRTYGASRSVKPLLARLSRRLRP